MGVRLGRLPRWLSAAAVAYSFWLAGFAWFVGGVQRCFEHCYRHSDPAAASFGWSRFWDAWQWPVIAGLGMALLLLAAAMAVLMWRERRGLSTAAAGAWAAAALALTVLVASASTDTGIDPALWTGAGAALIGAAVASEWWPA
jgi:hypothetical protein